MGRLVLVLISLVLVGCDAKIEQSSSVSGDIEKVATVGATKKIWLYENEHDRCYIVSGSSKPAISCVKK